MSSGDRDRARGKRKKKNTAKAFCQYLPVCPRSPEPYIFFANPHGCPVCARRHFCCADSPSAGVLRGKAGGSFFYKKFPPPVLFPFLVKFLFVKRLQTFLGEKADFVAGFFQLLAAGAGERQPFLVQANAVLKRKFAVFQLGDDFLKSAQPILEGRGFLGGHAGSYCLGTRERGSTATPRILTPRCRCGPVTRPVAPTRPICCPALTISPGFTSRRDMCA